MAVNPKSKANLKPFKKGVDERRANNGRKPKLPELDVLLADVLGEIEDGMETAKAILIAMKRKALKGDTKAAELILDRAYGKSKQVIESTVEDVTKRPTIKMPGGITIDL